MNLQGLYFFQSQKLLTRPYGEFRIVHFHSTLERISELGILLKQWRNLQSHIKPDASAVLSFLSWHIWCGRNNSLKQHTLRTLEMIIKIVLSDVSIFSSAPSFQYSHLITVLSVCSIYVGFYWSFTVLSFHKYWSHTDITTLNG